MADYNIAVKVTNTGLDATVRTLTNLDKISSKAIITVNGLTNALQNLSKIDLSHFQNLFQASVINASKLNAETNNIKINLNDLAGEFQKINSSLGNVSVSAERITNSIETADKTAMDFGTTLFGITATMEIASRTFSFGKNFIQDTIQARSSLQQLERQLKAVLGSEEAVNQELPKLRKMANTTPNVDTEGAVKGVSTFMRMGNSIDEARRKMEVLANTTAYYGGTVENVKLALVQFEQMANKNGGWGEDIRSLTNHIPGIRQLIMDKWGTTDQEELKKLGITSGKQLVEGIFEAMGEIAKVDGGISEQFSQLEDNILQIKADLGEAFLPTFNKIVDIAGKFSNIIKALPKPIKDFGAHAVVVASIGSAFLLATVGVKKLFDIMKMGKAELTGLATKFFTQIGIQKQYDNANKENTVSNEALSNSISKVGFLLTALNKVYQQNTQIINVNSRALAMNNALRITSGRGMGNMPALPGAVGGMPALPGVGSTISGGTGAFPVLGRAVKGLGNFAKSFGGIMALGIIGEMAGSAIENNAIKKREELGDKALDSNGKASKELKQSQWQTVGGKALSWGAQGAMYGAMAGSFIPVIGTGIGAAIGGGIGLVSGAVSGLMQNKDEFNKLSKEQRDKRIELGYQERISNAQKNGDKDEEAVANARMELDKLRADYDKAKPWNKKKLEADIETQTLALNSALKTQADNRKADKEKVNAELEAKKELNNQQIEINKKLLEGNDIEAKKLEIGYKYSNILKNQQLTAEERTIAEQEYNIALNEILEKEKQRQKINAVKLDISKDILNGNGDLASLKSAWLQYDNVYSDKNASAEEKMIANNEYEVAKNQYSLKQLSKTRKMQISQATLSGDSSKAKEISALSEYEQVNNDITKSIQEKWTAYYNYMTVMANNQADNLRKSIQKQKDSINEIIQKRKQNTDNVISELQRERNAKSSFYEEGQMAVLTSGYMDTSLVAENYSQEEILNAQNTVNLRKQIEKSNKNQVDMALYGTNTESVENQMKNISNLEKYISDNNMTGQKMLDYVQNLYTQINGVFNILNNANKRVMN